MHLMRLPTEIIGKTVCISIPVHALFDEDDEISNHWTFWSSQGPVTPFNVFAHSQSIRARDVMAGDTCVLFRRPGPGLKALLEMDFDTDLEMVLKKIEDFRGEHHYRVKA